MGRLKSPVVAAIASAALTATVVGGVAIAETSTDARITACVAQNSGHVRIVGSVEDCKPNEQDTYWSQQGPKGDPGPAGLPGPPGPPGPGTERVESRLVAMETALQQVTGRIVLSWSARVLSAEWSALKPGTTLTLIVTSDAHGEFRVTFDEFVVEADGAGGPSPLSSSAFGCQEGVSYQVVGTGRFDTAVESNVLRPPCD